MAISKSDYLEREALEMGASMMAPSARTAPKTREVDSVKTMVLTEKDLGQLAIEMEKNANGKSVELPTFWRDANNVRNSVAVLLVVGYRETLNGLNFR